MRVNDLITNMATTIKNITFRHYKALENYSVDIDHVNILTGSNNSGKSTVLGSLRVLAVALRTAKKSTPQRISLGDSYCYGYRIKESLVPISLENVATNYVDGSTKISFQISNGNSLHLIFDRDAGCVLVPDTLTGSVRTTGDFKKQFPIGLTVIPVLGPVEHRESLREVETVTSSLSTHRASRHFRNYWHHFPEDFDEFSELIERTWPGMRIQRPEINNTNELSMFVSEDRIDRELYWVGFGFQIWCQLLTHLHRADPATMIVIDEPEVYLHPDIQRRLLQVLKDTGADILVATHSVEIISQAEFGEIVRIDKRKTKAEREGAATNYRRSPSDNIKLPIPKKIAKAVSLPLPSKDISLGRFFETRSTIKQANLEGESNPIALTTKNDILDAAISTQKLISNHTPIDASQDWDEIDIELPAAASPQNRYEEKDNSHADQGKAILKSNQAK